MIVARVGEKLVLSVLVATFALGGALAQVTTTHAQAGSNPYPVGSSTFWAWQNRPDLPADLGEARNWDEAAGARGWPVDASPRLYDIAVFEPGVQDAGANRGHVAVVRQVLDNSTFSATEMNDADCAGGSANCGRIITKQYSIAPGVRFIHYLKDSRTTWGFANGASGWTALNLGKGQAQSSGWLYPLTGKAPQLISPALDIPLDGYNTVAIEMAVSPQVTDTHIQLYFATASKPDFAASRSAWLRANPDGAVHTYRIYLGSHPDWQGKLTGLRFNPSGASSTGSINMQRIRLLNESSNLYGSMASLTLAH